MAVNQSLQRHGEALAQRLFYNVPSLRYRQLHHLPSLLSLSNAPATAKFIKNNNSVTPSQLTTIFENRKIINSSWSLSNVRSFHSVAFTKTNDARTIPDPRPPLSNAAKAENINQVHKPIDINHNNNSNKNNEEEAKKDKKRAGLKELMKKYGYAALGVYLFLSMLDLPLCYLFVASVGDEKIKEYQEKVKQFFGIGQSKDRENGSFKKEEENDKKGSKYSAFWTTFFIAYGLHKSLVFIRLPLTATLTPSIVKQLQKFGFNIGRTSTRSVYAVTRDSIKDRGIKQSVLSKEGLKKNIEIANQQTILKNQKTAANSAASRSSQYSQLDPERFGTTASKKKRWWNFFL